MLEMYLKDIKDLPRISQEREIELSKIIIHSENEKEVDNAVTEMVEANVRLAIKWAFQYYRKYVSSLSEMDLIEEANLGLVKAAKKFDYRYKNRFSSYAVRSITSHMDRAIQNSRVVRIPLNHFKHLNKLRKLIEEHGEDVSDDVLMEELEISYYMLKSLKEDLSHRVVEIDSSDAMRNTLHSEVDEPFKGIQLGELREELMDSIDELSPVEKEIILSKHFSQEEVTYEQIASEYGVSRQRIGQIYADALKKLKRRIKRRNNSVIRSIEDEIKKNKSHNNVGGDSVEGRTDEEEK